MPTYFVLMNMTDTGVKSIKSAPERIERTIKEFEATGGKVLDFYVVMGHYDFVCIAQGPTDEAIVAFSLMVNASGNVKTTLLKAFSREQFAQVVKDIH